MNSRCLVGAVAVLLGTLLAWGSPSPVQAENPVAPHRPVQLLTEAGDPINPLTGQNADQPYSPRKTCGACHDYLSITEGYHFQMGRDKVADTFDPQQPWVLSPGMYGKY